jgi:hypothetical protein
MKKKELHQVKTRWYYIFWGAMTATVFVGQSIVYSGYMEMASSVNLLTKTILEVRISEMEDELRKQFEQKGFEL